MDVNCDKLDIRSPLNNPTFDIDPRLTLQNAAGSYEFAARNGSPSPRLHLGDAQSYYVVRLNDFGAGRHAYGGRTRRCRYWRKDAE